MRTQFDAALVLGQPETRLIRPPGEDGLTLNLRRERQNRDTIAAVCLGAGYLPTRFFFEPYRLAGQTFYGLRSDMVSGLPRQRLQPPGGKGLREIVISSP